MRFKYIFFDLANTLLYKDGLYEAIGESLKVFGINIERRVLLKSHKIVSEIILSPEKTTKTFYDKFNSEFLYSLGVVPTRKMIDLIYKNASNLPWKAFSDIQALRALNVDIGIVANWDVSARRKINKLLDINFKDIIISSEVGVTKPSLDIFKVAFSKVKSAPREILYVGDSIRLDLEPASKSGAQPVLLDRDNIYPYYKDPRIRSLDQLKNLLKT